MTMDDDFSSPDDDVLVAILIDEDEELIVDVSSEDAEVIELPTYVEEVSEIIVISEIETIIIDEPESESVLEIQEESEQESVVVTSFQDRLQEKFRNQSRTKRQWLFVVGCAMVVIFTLIILALESPFYNVDSVSIKNASATPLSDAENKKLESLTKHLKDQPMYRVDYDSTIKKIEAIPTISGVSISKKWPSSLDIEVSRRVPVAYIETDKGIILVDADGYAYEKTKTVPAGIPSIDGLDEVTFTHKVGDTTYLSIMEKAPQEIKNQISHIKKEKSNYVLELSDGIDVRLGDNKRLEEKLAIVWSVINAKKRSELGYIDVSVPSLPVSGSPQLQL